MPNKRHQQDAHKDLDRVVDKGSDSGPWSGSLCCFLEYQALVLADDHGLPGPKSFIALDDHLHFRLYIATNLYQ